MHYCPTLPRWMAILVPFPRIDRHTFPTRKLTLISALQSVLKTHLMADAPVQMGGVVAVASMEATPAGWLSDAVSDQMDFSEEPMSRILRSVTLNNLRQLVLTIMTAHGQNSADEFDLLIEKDECQQGELNESDLAWLLHKLANIYGVKVRKGKERSALIRHNLKSIKSFSPVNVERHQWSPELALLATLSCFPSWEELNDQWLLLWVWALVAVLPLDVYLMLNKKNVFDERSVMTRIKSGWQHQHSICKMKNSKRHPYAIEKNGQLHVYSGRYIVPADNKDALIRALTELSSKTQTQPVAKRARRSFHHWLRQLHSEQSQMAVSLHIRMQRYTWAPKQAAIAAQQFMDDFNTTLSDPHEAFLAAVANNDRDNWCRALRLALATGLHNLPTIISRPRAPMVDATNHPLWPLLSSSSLAFNSQTVKNSTLADVYLEWSNFKNLFETLDSVTVSDLAALVKRIDQGLKPLLESFQTLRNTGLMREDILSHVGDSWNSMLKARRIVMHLACSLAKTKTEFQKMADFIQFTNCTICKPFAPDLYPWAHPMASIHGGSLGGYAVQAQYAYALHCATSYEEKSMIQRALDTLQLIAKIGLPVPETVLRATNLGDLNEAWDKWLSDDVRFAGECIWDHRGSICETVGCSRSTKIHPYIDSRPPCDPALELRSDLLSAVQSCLRQTLHRLVHHVLPNAKSFMDRIESRKMFLSDRPTALAFLYAVLRGFDDRSMYSETSGMKAILDSLYEMV